MTDNTLIMNKKKVSALFVTLIDDATNRIVYAKTPHLKRQPASTTKLLTAIVAIETMDLNTVVTIPSYVSKIPPSKIHLRGGERYRVRELVRALLINSANDAAEALAYAGGRGQRSRFLALMNKKARALGCTHSNFATPSGLPAANHYSTAYDMSLIMGEVQRYPFLVQTLSTRTLIIKSNSGRKIYLRNHNRMLWRSSRSVIGKTGWTRLARHCFVGEFVVNNRKVFVAMLGSHALWRDLRTLVNSQFGTAFLRRSENTSPKAIKPTGRNVQLALKKAGYFRGTVTGKIGPKTRAAIKKFQKAKGLKTTGQAGPATWKLLKSYLS